MTVELINPYRLKDQSQVALSLVKPSDRIRLLNGFDRISARTNINRFHSFKERFSENELDYLLSIDNVNHLAIGAIDANRDSDVGIGLVRYIRNQSLPEQAEVAIIIIDEYQGKGLGNLLYGEMIKIAAYHGIRKLLNTVKKDNQAMLNLLKRFAAKKISELEQQYEYVVYTEETQQLSGMRLMGVAGKEGHCN